jgi:hypothetical protein
MTQTPNTAIAVIGIDIGKNSFHVVGHDAGGTIVLRQSAAKWKRGSPISHLALPDRHGSLRRRPHVSFRGQTLVREGSSLVKLRDSA